MALTRPAITPRLLREADAALYLGMSPSKLRTLGIERRALDGMRFYDRIDLDAWASALPYEGEGENPCDEIFGVAS